MAEKFDQAFDISLFRRLFVHRDDVFSMQSSTGEYHPMRRKLSDQHIKDHVRGQHTLGLYQLKHVEGETSATVKWACLDIDILKPTYDVPNFDVTKWDDKLNRQVELAQLTLNKFGMPHYVEDSGQKGRHIWIFFENPVDAVLVKRAMDAMFSPKVMANVDDKNIDWEIFPKQTRSLNAYGNLVKVPFSIHQKTKRRSVFHGNMSDIKFVTVNQLEATQSPYEAIFQGCGAFRNLESAVTVTNHLNHKERLALAYVFWNLPNDEFDYDKHPGAKYFQEKILSKTNDHNVDKIKTEFNHHKGIKTDLHGNEKRGYSPATCKFLQSSSGGNVCSGPCQAIGKAKSPIAFYFRAQGKEEPQDVKPDDAVERFFRPDMYYIEGYTYVQRAEPASGKQVQGPDMIVSNFIVTWDKEYTYDDGIETTKFFEGHILSDDIVGNKIPFKVESKEFADDRSLAKEIYKAMGAQVFIDNYKKLKEAIFKHTNTEKIDVLKIFGYNENKTKYLTPSVLVDAEGIHDNSKTLVHLSGETAEVLDLSIIDNDKFELLKVHIKDELLNVLEWHVTHASFAHTMLPIIGSYLEDGADINRYTFLLRGISGTGKSHLMNALQHFYSPDFGAAVSWTSTPNALQRIGFFFKDALFLVDDLKKKNISRQYDQVLAYLQNYADGTTRDRMTQDATMQRSFPVRGYLAVSGEDTLEGEASNLARMVTVVTKNSSKKMKIGNKMKQWQGSYSAFTARYIHHILNTDKSEIVDTFLKYVEIFYKMVDGQHNDIRISKNLAQLMTSYYYSMGFLYSDDPAQAESNIKTMLACLKGLIIKLVEDVKDETPSRVFWETTQDLLVREEVYIQEGNMLVSDKPKYSSTMIGYISNTNNRIYFLSSFFDSIQTYLDRIGKPIAHSKKVVLEGLVELGVLESSKSTAVRLNGTAQRVYKATAGARDIT